MKYLNLDQVNGASLSTTTTTSTTMTWLGLLGELLIMAKVASQGVCQRTSRLAFFIRVVRRPSKSSTKSGGDSYE